MTHHLSAIAIFKFLLPPVALGLWVLMYVIYLWREPAIRLWLDRHVSSVGRARRRREVAVSVPPLMFRRIAPAPRPRPPRLAIAVGAPVTPSPEIKVAEWRVDHLPLRYRLLGRVRTAANDN